MNTITYDAIFNPAASEAASALMWANLQAVSDATKEARAALRPHTEYDAWAIDYRKTPAAEVRAEAERKAKARKTIEKRIACERKVVRFAVRHLLKRGYTITVAYGGGEFGVKQSTSERAIMAAVQACDDEWLNVWKRGADGKLVRSGTIALVYGNSGPEVIADYNLSLEDDMAEINAYCDKLEA